jgi:DNA-binding NarL/FixJ family response regulator
VVLDADECEGNAPRLAARIRRAVPTACVMIVASSATPREVEHAVEAGVSGYVGKNRSMYALLGALLEGARYRRLRSA